MTPERLRKFIYEYIEDEFVQGGGDSLGEEIWRELVYHYGLTPEEVK